MRRLVRICWALSLLSILIWSLLPTYESGWDVAVYRNAVVSLHAGHDPYADAIAVQQAYHLNPHRYEPGYPIPYSYVYSPITLPVIRAIGLLPLRPFIAVYWAIYALGFAITLYVQVKLLETEAASVALLVPFVVFFPGLLATDTLFSGNVAIILYGAVFAGAYAAWRTGRWRWFYLAVLITGCFKAPMLSLLVLPICTARRQWFRALATGVAGVGLFLLQPRIWPTLFAHYLKAVDLQFLYNRDFSSSPAGLIANALFFHAPYRTTSAVAYLAYAVVVFVVLFVLGRSYQRGELTLSEYAPLLLVGAVLLNPRIMEYDLLPVTLPMTVLALRFFRRGCTPAVAALRMAAFFAVINAVALVPHRGLSNPPWKLTAGCTIAAVFIAGAWQLHRVVQDRRAQNRRSSAELPIDAGNLRNAVGRG